MQRNIDLNEVFALGGAMCTAAVAFEVMFERGDVPDYVRGMAQDVIAQYLRYWPTAMARRHEQALRMNAEFDAKRRRAA
jgi:hypothetical protein